ncbi:hypothetical protein PR202_gb13021 [Eleusine coracana subsp. coracana]|uniref:Glucosidase II beta subunit N-terminal domain-containing protein n=1 Tax=Eleusine coracana subsp. coracana TaxID=191504 RepID=A0AAV5ES40_ELECO|nr:hypothetical protein PR202_gb13021 [Eleusine coracana subsp. coracana]
MRRLLLVAAVLLGAVAASKPPLDTLGIPPQDEAYYKGGVIKCRDGSGRFTRDKLNDDFCDCPDGTDEPGNPFILLWGCSSEWTSACPEGKFYCKNAGHTPITIFSSRVNDGICGKRIGCSNSVPSYLLDCCDGSDDEYDSNKLKKAKEAYAKDEVELAKLKGEEKILQGLVDKLKEQKKLIEKAEEEERLRKEKEEKRIKEEADKLAAAEKKATDSSQSVDSKETNEHVKQDESKVGIPVLYFHWLLIIVASI